MRQNTGQNPESEPLQGKQQLARFMSELAYIGVFHSYTLLLGTAGGLHNPIPPHQRFGWHKLTHDFAVEPSVISYPSPWLTGAPGLAFAFGMNGACAERFWGLPNCSCCPPVIGGRERCFASGDSPHLNCDRSRDYLSVGAQAFISGERIIRDWIW